jgi:lipooligosaccharide transport system permease protein
MTAITRPAAQGALAIAWARIWRARRLVERNIMVYRHQWIIIFSGVFEPIFYLLGIGLGIGGIVGEIPAVFVGGRTDVSYLAYVAPALVATAAMNGAVFETIFNVFFKLNYAKTYDGVLSTPMGVRDIAVGETIFALMRGAVYAVAFVAIMLALGLVESFWAILAIPAALLVGAAFAALGLSAVTMMRSWADFAYIELMTLPMFLFSATFVPLEEYPQPVQWALPLTPLYHGVDLIRKLTLGNVGWDVLIHVAYLLGVLALGVWFTARRLERKLLK